MKKESDVAKFRRALRAVGFVYRSSIFNDKRKYGRRLKLWHADAVLDAPHSTKVKLVGQLQKEFGDRLTSVQPHVYNVGMWGAVGCVVVRLKN